MTHTLVQDPIATYVAGHEFTMLMGGRFVEAADGAVAEVRDPSTGARLTTVPSAGAADVERAVAAARAAQPTWEALGVEGRAACFARFDELLTEHRERLAMLDAIDCGNPVRAMRIDVDLCHDYVRGWPSLAAAMAGDVIPASPGNLHYTAHRPYGVVGRITAFNHPLMFA